MIRVRGVSKVFEGRAVLREITLGVPPGSTYVVLGQSGIGKSVLLKIIAGLLRPDEGTVELGSRDVGMLFQKNALFDSMTAFENLEFPLRERSTLCAADRRARIAQYLEWVELAGAEERFPDELSGGMQKRLGIARALIVQPEIILYDEPTAGLDPITSRLIADLILRLRREMRSTVVAVTSDVKRAFQLADGIGLLVPTAGSGAGGAGATLLNGGTPEEVAASREPRMRQFLEGATTGPLTAAAEKSELNVD
ncbi:MAG: ATP-binding cassette domain-containing protein [Deltaproteobacteria bacterium]|nr:ATP-binding cassette domain-containing protein [Deltaproteobacteria bacterium]